jgi:pimeloyl-ACP methyl ester carboxylesterase
VSASPTTGYAPVNGVDVYWESRGQGGTPLIVVHGGYGLASMFGDLLDDLSVQRRVIAIELQGHGHTRDIDRPFSFEGFGDEIAGVVGSLGLSRVDLLGYSSGAKPACDARSSTPTGSAGSPLSRFPVGVPDGSPRYSPRSIR